MYQDSLMDIWERLRDELRMLRGRNEWRGIETHLLPKREIRMKTEPRGARKMGPEMIIHVSDAEVEVWAEWEHGGKQFYLKDFNHDMKAFVKHLTVLCGGGGYLETNPEKADYRKQEEVVK